MCLPSHPRSGLGYPCPGRLCAAVTPNVLVPGSSVHADPGDLARTRELGLPGAVAQRRGRSSGTAAAARRLRPRSSRGRCGGGERGPPPCRGLLARPPCAGAGAGAGAERAGGIPPPPRPGPREIQPPWLGRLRLPLPRPLSARSGLRSPRGPSARGSAVPGPGARTRARSRSAPGPGRRHHVTPAGARPGQVSSREGWGPGRAGRAFCSAPQARPGCSPGAAHARGSRGLGSGPAMGGGAGPRRPPPTSPWAWRPACLTPGTGWGPRAPQTRCPGRGRGRPASARPALARLEWKLGSGREVDCGGKSWCWGDPERSFLCRCVSVLVSVVRVSPCGSVGE